MGKITATKVRNLSQPGRYPDGDGLFLEVRGASKGSWVLRAQAGGKRRDINLSTLKAMSLADARHAAYEIRRQLAQGIDPVAERKKERLVIPTFKEAAKLVHEEHKAGWKNGKHQNQLLTTFGDLRLSFVGRSPGQRGRHGGDWGRTCDHLA